ncbi:MAG: helix-turn-helix domain-containing protein [Thermomicrobiales bacterium]
MRPQLQSINTRYWRRCTRKNWRPLRERLGLNQSFVAERIGVSQSRISQLERGDLDRSELSTIRAYLAAERGEIEVVARFGDERIRII